MPIQGRSRDGRKGDKLDPIKIELKWPNFVPYSSQSITTEEQELRSAKHSSSTDLMSTLLQHEADSSVEVAIIDSTQERDLSGWVAGTLLIERSVLKVGTVLTHLPLHLFLLSVENLIGW